MLRNIKILTQIKNCNLKSMKNAFSQEFSKKICMKEFEYNIFFFIIKIIIALKLKCELLNKLF